MVFTLDGIVIRGNITLRRVLGWIDVSEWKSQNENTLNPQSFTHQKLHKLFTHCQMRQSHISRPLLIQSYSEFYISANNNSPSFLCCFSRFLFTPTLLLMPRTLSPRLFSNPLYYILGSSAGGHKMKESSQRVGRSIIMNRVNDPVLKMWAIQCSV